MKASILLRTTWAPRKNEPRLKASRAAARPPRVPRKPGKTRVAIFLCDRGRGDRFSEKFSDGATDFPVLFGARCSSAAGRNALSGASCAHHEAPDRADGAADDDAASAASLRKLESAERIDCITESPAVESASAERAERRADSG